MLLNLVCLNLTNTAEVQTVIEILTGRLVRLARDGKLGTSDFLVGHDPVVVELIRGFYCKSIRVDIYCRHNTTT